MILLSIIHIGLEVVGDRLHPESGLSAALESFHA
jgi:hypothetical protein